MNHQDFINTVKRHFDLSFIMLEQMIRQCPDELWNKKKGGFIFWQQLLHTFTGINFWMRLTNEPFIEPFADKQVYPELDQDPVGYLDKNDISGFKDTVKAICENFFANHYDEWLNCPSIIYDKVQNIDIVFMQIRHIQYHVGHCNSILRENGFEAVEWLDYYGD